MTVAAAALVVVVVAAVAHVCDVVSPCGSVKHMSSLASLSR